MAYDPDPNIVNTPFGALAPIIQDGLVSRVIRNSLQQNLMFGIEFSEAEQWMNNIGQTVTIARDAPMTVRDEPVNPDVDAQYKAAKYEETVTQVSVYRDAIKLNMLQNAAVIPGYFANRMNTLGRNAADSLNAIRRKALYSGYLGGHAVALVTAGPTTSLRVSQINGFKKQINSDGKYLDVSSSNPKPILIGASTYALVTGTAADSALFPDGRGTLTLSANASWSVNDAVVAMDAPYRVYQGGGTTVDAISSSDILTLDSLRKALALHSENAIPPHPEDGTYWVHMGPRVKQQLWADPEFQNVIRGGVQTTQFNGYELSRCMGCTFIENHQVPTRNNASALQDSRLSTTDAKLSKSVYGEIVNRNNVELGHTLVTGGGLGKTWYMSQNQLASAAGLNAKEFYGMQVSADNMRYVVEDMVRFLIAAPKDDNRQFVPATWQFIGEFMLWNDLYGGSYSANNDAETTRNPYYKRAVAISHYAG